MEKYRKRLYEIIEVSKSEDKVSAAYDIFMMLLIIVSLIPLAYKTETPLFQVIDKVAVTFFCLDYVLRMITADLKCQKKSIVSFVRYPFTPMAIIDLISILPSVTMLNGGFRLFKIFRLFRSLRVFRVFKAARYSKSVQIIIEVFKEQKESLTTVFMFAVAYIFVSALVIFNVEPDTFSTFFDALYWATVSLTTMGYGDIYPVSNIGRFVTMLSSLVGIAIVALPSSIITAGYMEVVEKGKEDESHTGN